MRTNGRTAMNAAIRRFAKKRAQRAAALALPALLGLALASLALTRISSANTLWSQELTVRADFNTGTFGCQPYQIALTSTALSGGNTTFTYTFTGGGIAGAGCKYGISYIALSVCFDPDLQPKGLVLSETHPAPTSSSPPGKWTYDPDDSKASKRVKWNANDGVGHGPFNATFSITVAGAVSSTQRTFEVHAGNGQDVVASGTVAVPGIGTCTAASITQSSTSTQPGTGTTAPAPQGALIPLLIPATPTPTATRTPTPTATPTATRTPTPTPTPKSPARPSGGSVISPMSTPPPAPGD